MSSSKSKQQTVTTASIQTSNFEENNPTYPEDYIPTFVKPDFDKDAVVKGHVDKGGGYLCVLRASGQMEGNTLTTTDRVPAGSMLPLGAGIPENTVLKYGGYFPAGTSFPKGVLVPLHARLANVLPAETTDPPDPADDFSLCLIQ